MVREFGGAILIGVMLREGSEICFGAGGRDGNGERRKIVRFDIEYFTDLLNQGPSRVYKASKSCGTPTEKVIGVGGNLWRGSQ